MVSENVDIYLARAEQPVTGGAKWVEIDKARYTCNFELKNLTGKEVTVSVGFPLAGENYAIPRNNGKNEEINQAKLISQFDFIAGTNHGTYPIRYVQTDVNKKFTHIFLWDMTFKPDETINLLVSYSMIGYYGLGITQKPPFNWDQTRYGFKYLNELDTSVTQSFGYVTATGKSWYGTIEKATFTIRLGEYEKYLEKRGAFEIDEDYVYYQKHQEQAPFSALYRRITPTGWSEQGERNNRVVVYSFTDFKPEMEINIQYSFLLIPKNLKDYHKTISKIKENYNKNREMIIKANRPEIKIPAEWNVDAEKNISDIILEYYGISTNNPAISPFLNRQVWYPVDTPREMDGGLKEELLNIHEREDNSFISSIYQIFH
ncbi:MAG: hypothetical protein NT118_03180 [Lentisphaerae bacterium]|nr:hypothetical protein [Lentisphaerota bacterium]